MRNLIEEIFLSKYQHETNLNLKIIKTFNSLL